MKRTLQLSLLLLASLGNLAFSQIGGELTLKYGYSFNDSANPTQNEAKAPGSQDTTVLDVKAASGLTSHSVGIAGSNGVSQTQDLMQIDNLGMSSTTGFTIAMALNANNLSYSHIFKTNLSGALNGDFQYFTQTTTAVSVYQGIGGYHGPTVNSSWQAITLSVGTLESGQTQLTMTAFNMDGSIAATATRAVTGTVTLNTFTQGNGTDSANNKGSYLDNLLIYEGAADASQLAQIANSVLTSSTITDDMQTIIPEPGTATLSLLALAGLAARRRRKTA